jgi:hypothetical protein
MTFRALINATYAPTAVAALFSASAKTIIDKFTVTNVSDDDVEVDVHLVPSGGGAGPSNRLLRLTVRFGEAYLCAEVVGHMLEIGDAIHVRAATASAVCVRASGRE